MLSRKDSLDSKGFLILEDVISSADCNYILAILKTQSTGRAGRRDLITNPVIWALANNNRLLTLVNEVSGQMATPYKATIFEKASDYNWLVPWHQDRSLPFPKRFDAAGWGPWTLKDGINFALAPRWALEEVVALRIHLDDSTPVNGPLRVIRGTHLLGVIDQERVVDYAASSSFEICTVRKGGIVAMRPLLIHSSSKSDITAPRRVLHIEYSPDLALRNGIKPGSN